MVSLFRAGYRECSWRLLPEQLCICLRSTSTWNNTSEDTVKSSAKRLNAASVLLLLSRFSRVRLCATPQTAAHQAPLSLGFSRQEHWSGLPLPSPVHESESEVTQSCPTPSDPVDCSPPGSSVRGIFQARVLEWGAIAFSKERENSAKS